MGVSVREAGRRLVVALDIGGTKIAAAVVDAQGRLYARLRLPAEKHDHRQSVAQVVRAAREAVSACGADSGAIEAVGAAVPGIYFTSSGEVWAPNLPGWERVPLRRILEAELDLPAVVDSDRSACVLGEQWLGAARGFADVVFLTVGTGIGAGIITGGRLCRGAEGIAGAVGWLPLNPQECTLYRAVGCFEAEAAGPAVARRAQETAARTTSLMLPLAGGRTDRITAEIVAEAARQGDEPAQRVLAETGRWLGRGLAAIVSLLNPQLIVLGGGLMQAADLLLEEVRREMLLWTQPLAARSVRLELSRLGEDAALLGAARLALERDYVG